MGKKINKILSAAIFAAAGAYAYKAYTDHKKKVEGTRLVDSEMKNVAKEARDVVDFFKEKKDEFIASREYVTLNETAKTAKDILFKKVTEAAEKFVEKAEEIKDGVGVVSSEDKAGAEDFEFEDFDEEIESDLDNDVTEDEEESTSNEM